MSRYNLRAPLANNGSVLAQSTPPKAYGPGNAGRPADHQRGVPCIWGTFINAWLKQTGLLPQEGCPTAGSGTSTLTARSAR